MFVEIYLLLIIYCVSCVALIVGIYALYSTAELREYINRRFPVRTEGITKNLLKGNQNVRRK
jgi:hypothetical protein